MIKRSSPVVSEGSEGRPERHRPIRQLLGILLAMGATVAIGACFHDSPDDQRPTLLPPSTSPTTALQGSAACDSLDILVNSETHSAQLRTRAHAAGAAVLDSILYYIDGFADQVQVPIDQQPITHTFAKTPGADDHSVTSVVIYSLGGVTYGSPELCKQRFVFPAPQPTVSGR